MSYLNPFSDNFILKGLLSNLSTILSYINPFNENFFGYKLMDMLGDTFSYLFVPSEDSFTKLTNVVSSRFAFVDSVKIAGNSIKEMFTNLNIAPKFSLNIDSKFYKGELTIVDLSWYTPFKPYGDIVITGFAYVLFFWRLLNHIVSIVNGVSNSTSDINSFYKKGG